MHLAFSAFRLFLSIFQLFFNFLKKIIIKKMTNKVIFVKNMINFIYRNLFIISLKNKVKIYLICMLLMKFLKKSLIIILFKKKKKRKKNKFLMIKKLMIVVLKVLIILKIIFLINKNLVKMIKMYLLLKIIMIKKSN